jgi:flagellar biosynthetic protein FliS
MSDARLAYQEAAVRGARPVRLTILLYEQVIQDVSRASEAITRRDFETLAREISHATGVIGYLQATLNREASAIVVRNLASFYAMLREQLMEAQVRCSREILANLRQQMLEVREAWLKVEEDTSDEVA